jgi:nicotinate-nucleotide pyrophosphorylase (carboxylating)
VVPAFERVRAAWPGLPIEIEVDTLAQAREVIDAGADLVLLDNMSVDDMRAAVDYSAGRATLEASGGLTLDIAREVAQTGVDYLSVGALTHSAPVLDIGLDM